MNLVDLGEPTSFLDHVYLGCALREGKSNKKCFLRKTEECSHHESPLELLKSCAKK